METAYHNEALRKARVLERKSQAMKRLLQEGPGQPLEGGQVRDCAPVPLVHSEPGHYAQNREFSRYPHQPNGRRKFIRRPKEDIIRKPTPESVKRLQRDQVYHILHPAKLSYYKTGPTREMRQYDHSRNGPVVDKTNYALRREFNFLGNSLSMLKADIVPEHKPIPVCRRY